MVVVLADDLGFSDLGCYGSEISTPNLDAMAGRGLRYGNFHVTPLCSPTRAALMTGRNSHAAGMGYVANVDPGFPGYASELPAEQPSLAEVFRANGYSTFMVGKWHLAKDSDLSEAADRSSWPLQRGFDQYYGFLEALTNLHHPHRLYEGNSVVQVDRYPDGYYLTDDLTDRAVRMIRETKAANPSRPFFLYFAHAAVHAPLHVKDSDKSKYRGRYGIGWDRLREQRLARQIELGVVPPGTGLPPRNSEPGEDVAAWDSLSDRERTLFARYMELYAAMVETIDHSVGRVRDALDQLGELDNTLFLFTSDNGASREGRDKGRPAWYVARAGQDTSPGDQPDHLVDEGLARLDELGGPTTWPHYPRGWAMACNTPFRLYKVTTFAGGHQVPMILSWPARIDGRGQVVRRQYTHVTDVLPTLVDLLGLDLPTERNGLTARPLAGSSFAASVQDPRAPVAHGEQYFECVGNRAFHRDGWTAITFRQPGVPFSAERWQLYHVAEDPNELHDLADQHPDKVAELAQAWEHAAWANQVFPLHEGSGIKDWTRPPRDDRMSSPVRIPAGTPTLERYRASQLISGRSFRITVDWDHRPGDQGVLVAHGGQEGGYVLYVEDDTLHFAHNGFGTLRRLEPVTLRSLSRQVAVDVDAPGGSLWQVRLEVDGEVVGGVGEFPVLERFLPFGGIDVGIDRRSPVSWDLYRRHGCFPYTGALHAVTYTPGALAPDAGPLQLERARQAALALE
ncbi:MAG: arylsulfatase [Acidimicrobiia bacterium]